MAGVRLVAKRLGVSGITHAGCAGLGVGFERNPSNFTPRASAPKRASVVLRSVSVVPTSGHMVASSALVAAVSGPIVMVKPKNKVQPQSTKSAVVSLGRSGIRKARTGLHSQKDC